MIWLITAFSCIFLFTSWRVRNFRRIQSLYETVNSQMLVAQQLDHRLRELIEALYPPVGVREDIESLIEVSKGNLESLDLGADSYSRKKASVDSGEFNISSPVRISANISLQTPIKLDGSSGMRTGLLDSTRRRRDSVDKVRTVAIPNLLSCCQQLVTKCVKCIGFYFQILNACILFACLRRIVLDSPSWIVASGI